MTIKVRTGGAWVQVSDGSDGTGTTTDVLVSYTGRSAPCSLPITVTGTTTKTINIPSNSNAFGAKYVQTTQPTGTSICEGDIWYDTSQSGGGCFVTGMIIMFSGVTAPTGWVFCDNSTAAQDAGAPDLRDKFIIGGHTYNSTTNKWETNVTGGLTQSGGSKNAVLPAHEHKAPTYNGQSGPYETGYTTGGYDYGAQAAPTEKTAIDASGTTTTGASATLTGTNANLPPYYALSYIMKT